MATQKVVAPATPTESEAMARLRSQYGFGPIQAPAAECAAHRGALQAAAGGSQSRDTAEDVFLCRQSGACIPTGKTHHLIH